jgi:hypothetical protein
MATQDVTPAPEGLTRAELDRVLIEAFLHGHDEAHAAALCTHIDDSPAEMAAFVVRSAGRRHIETPKMAAYVAEPVKRCRP